ncbi:hypothetical protein SUDANB176_00386 [Streptomyces sp. enrichment culture]
MEHGGSEVTQRHRVGRGVDGRGGPCPGDPLGSSGVSPLPLMRVAQPGALLHRHTRADPGDARTESLTGTGTGGQELLDGKTGLGTRPGAALAQAARLGRPDAADRARAFAVDAACRRRRYRSAPGRDIAGGSGRAPGCHASLAQSRRTARGTVARRVNAAAEGMPAGAEREARLRCGAVKAVCKQVAPVRLLPPDGCRGRRRGRRTHARPKSLSVMVWAAWTTLPSETFRWVSRLSTSLCPSSR